MGRKPYFFSSGLDSLGEEGVVTVPDGLDELAAPVPPGGVLASAAPGAGVGAGAGAATGALGAGGGVVTVFSSFLQAVRPTATRAAIRSERVIFLVL